MIGGETVIGLRQHEKITEKEKKDALKKMYEDPFEDLLNIMQGHIKELLEPYPKYQPPLLKEEDEPRSGSIIDNIEERVGEKVKEIVQGLNLSKISEEGEDLRQLDQRV